MNLTPREKDKLLVAMAAEVARKRLARGVKLNHPEAVALITDFVVEGARDGKSVAELMRDGGTVLEFARRHGVSASAETQKRLRAERDLESIEHWAGPLDREQRVRFTALSEAQPLDAALRQQDRMRRQREFLALLRERHDERFADRLRDWLLDWNASRPADLAARVQAHEQARRRMLLTVYAELRPDQRRKVSERLRFYIAVMRDLAGDARQHADAGAAQAVTPP